MPKKSSPIPEIFSDIYHSYDPTDLEMKYLELHMKSTEENDPTYLLQIYDLALINNDKIMRDSVFDLLVNW